MGGEERGMKGERRRLFKLLPVFHWHQLSVLQCCTIKSALYKCTYVYNCTCIIFVMSLCFHVSTGDGGGIISIEVTEKLGLVC